MASWPAQMAGAWVGGLIDEATRRMAATFSGQGASTTMELDKSQPPTPDGTGLPANFAMVGPGIYRASYPQAVHFAALEPFQLKTIITFVGEDIPSEYQAFMSERGISHHRISILANKDPETFTDPSIINSVIELMMDKKNHPMLIHCNKGKHRTGTITACFRKVTGWTIEACVAEYVKYSTPKERHLDKLYIANFDATVLKGLAREMGFVGGAFSQPYVESSNASERTIDTIISDNSNTPLHQGESGDQLFFSQDPYR